MSRHPDPKPLLSVACTALLLLAACGGDSSGGSDPAPTCSDSRRNGAETGVDCGGGGCPACGEGQGCEAPEDCTSLVCQSTCQPIECGDEVISPGEVCDDGNGVSDDGCSTTCTPEAGWDCGADEPTVCVEHCDDGLRVGTEQCDDGNGASGDGCSSCQTDPGFSCSGSPSSCSTICGDGLRTGFGICSGASMVLPEACDDGNLVSDDGCSATCGIEPGYTCPIDGAPCVTTCGDGARAGREQCDDGATANGDGCSSTCRWEVGKACTGVAPSYTCHATVCGDNTKEGSEACDDGNWIPGDGCDASCRVEPTCTPGAGCPAKCGDGLTQSPEQCDDGNTLSGDGCSSTCQVEPGYACTQSAPCDQVGETCVLRLPIIYRDFIGSDYGGHPDFQVGCGTLITGLTNSLLAASGYPVLSSASRPDACITSAATFRNWFDFSQTGTTFGAPIVGELLLWDDGAGHFVNRYRSDGTRWGQGPTFSGARWCSNASNDCAACGTLGAGEVCLGTCTPWGNSQTCAATYTMAPGMDGNPLFFPLDQVAGAITPYSAQYATASIPAEIYDGGWSAEPGGALHNFGFTSRVKFWFTFDSSRSYTITFTGDDDVWVFVNGTLAIDLGGLHVPTLGTVTLSAANAATYGLSNGKVYDVQVFQAERKRTASSYRLSLSGFANSPSVCTPVRGDGIQTPDEQCDAGTARNTGGHGKCKPDCTLDAWCGDGVPNGPEACDNGVNLDATGSVGAGECAPGCRAPPDCGG